MKRVGMGLYFNALLGLLVGLCLGIFVEYAHAGKEKENLKSMRPGEAAGFGESVVLEGAEDRIEKYRQGTAVIRVVARDGLPVVDAEISIEQTNHEFLFGCGRNQKILNVIFSKKYGGRQGKLGMDLKAEDIKEYLRRFVEFPNYTFVRVNWDSYEPRPGIVNQSVYDGEIQWLRNKGFKLRAGQLVWNFKTPDWVPDQCDQLAAAVEQRIRGFISRYRGQIDFFSVVNEAAQPFRPNFTKDKMTRCYRELGQKELVGRAFKAARKADPAGELLINEVAIEEKKGFPELLNALKDDHGRPLYDVIGIQSHMHRKLWTLQRVWETCENYSRFGVPIQFTEVTILSGTPMAGEQFGLQTTPEGERMQAEYAMKLYTVLFSHPTVEGITWWNLADLGAFRDAPGGLLRKDMSAKPAYHALMDLIWKKWRTTVKTRTSDNGDCRFKGFFGDYRMTVTTRSGESKSFEVKLSKQTEGVIRLNL